MNDPDLSALRDFENFPPPANYPNCPCKYRHPAGAGTHRDDGLATSLFPNCPRVVTKFRLAGPRLSAQAGFRWAG
jgi:hypothetical protein